jgi:hypothetical protein
MQNLSHNSLYPGRDPYQISPEYKSTEIPLYQPARCLLFHPEDGGSKFFRNTDTYLPKLHGITSFTVTVVKNHKSHSNLFLFWYPVLFGTKELVVFLQLIPIYCTWSMPDLGFTQFYTGNESLPSVSERLGEMRMDWEIHGTGPQHLDICATPTTSFIFNLMRTGSPGGPAWQAASHQRRGPTRQLWYVYS